jgi:hypothetical protein
MTDLLFRGPLRALRTLPLPAPRLGGPRRLGGDGWRVEGGALMYGGGGVFVFFAIGVDLSFIHLSLSALAVSCPARVGRICPLRFIAYARARFVVDFCRGLVVLVLVPASVSGPGPLSCFL